MKVLVLDDERKRADFIREMFSGKKINATVCSSSNDFMAAIGASNFEAVYINAEAWKKGRCIYDYFGVGLKLENKPAVVYNADERFCGIRDRNAHESDRVLDKPSNIEAAIDTI